MKYDVEQVPLSDIVIGKRYRKEMGDLRGLSDSMEIRQLQPIGIDRENRLLFGHRRYLAASALNWETIAAIRFDDLLTALDYTKIEQDENTCRKDFSPSEAHAIAKDIAEMEKPKAEERKKATQAKPGEKAAQGATKFVEPCDKGRTDDKAAAATGYSRESLRKIAKVMEAAEENPDEVQPIVDEMDRTGKVEPAYQAVKRLEPGTAAMPKPSKEALEADKDSEVLFSLKRYWGKASKKDRKAFRQWIDQRGER